MAGNSDFSLFDILGGRFDTNKHIQNTHAKLSSS